MDRSRLPLARGDVDRAAHRRLEPDLLGRLRADPATRVVVLRDGRIATREGGARLDLRAPGDVPADALWLFLGEDDGVAYVAADVPDAVDAVDPEGVPTAEALDGLTWSTLRETGHLLPDVEAGLATAAVGLAAWHARHPRCPRCGAATRPATAGWTRRCPEDGSEHYPRTDPAVIMAVTDEADRLLLAHATHWPARRFSTLAGYVEPGESLEAAVRREVAEETGVVVGDVTYRGSQPWPFPASLMLAFTARATTTDVRVDGVELGEARWFTREELVRAVADGDVLLPMRTSVARVLIEEWLGDTLA